MPREWALLLSPVRPDAYGGGLAKRAWHWVAELSATYDVLTVVVATHDRQKQGSTRVPGRLETIDVPPRLPSDPGAPDWTKTTPDTKAALNAILPTRTPARVVVFRFYLHPLIDLLPESWRSRAEMDIDDWESATRRSLAGLAIRHGRIREAYDHRQGARAYAALERDLLRRYARVSVAAEEDVAPLMSLTGFATIAARPNCIAATRNVAPPATMTSNCMLFVGTLDYLPNEDAVMWLAKRILPRVRAVIPDARVVIAGRNPPRRVLALQAEGFVYAGAPADLADCFAAASIVVAPIRGGGGTKLKVPEAWFYRRPLVATTHAARGYGAVDGHHLLIADGTADFATACIRLMQDRSLAARLVDAGDDLLRKHFLLPAATHADGGEDRA